MSFKAGVIVGAAVGYVLGAKAGRDRYDQIMEMFGRVSDDERFQNIASKGKAVVDLAAERVKETVGEQFGDGDTDEG